MASRYSLDQETAHLVRELRCGWFGEAKKPLQGVARGTIAFMGSLSVLAIMMWMFLTTGNLSIQIQQLAQLWGPVLSVVVILPVLLALVISTSDRPAGQLRIFLTGAAVTSLMFSMAAIPFSLMYRAAG